MEENSSVSTVVYVKSNDIYLGSHLNNLQPVNYHFLISLIRGPRQYLLEGREII